MTTVNLSRLVPGQTTDVTASPSPNTTITSLNSASAAIDLNNLRLEGIDWRNIKAPLIEVGSTSGTNGGSMNRHESGTINLGLISGWTGVGAAGTLQFDVTNLYAVAIRASFRVLVEGKNAPSNGEQAEVGFKLMWCPAGSTSLMNLPGTERWWQCALNRAANTDIPDKGTFTTAFDMRLRATTTVHWCGRVSEIAAFTGTNLIQVYLVANLNYYNAIGANDFTINDLNMHCVGYRGSI